MSNFVTVRQAFERAYGPIPELATCHIGYTYFTDRRISATYGHNHNVYTHIEPLGVWQGDNYDNEEVLGPDISDRPASAFVGFFGEAYDNAVRELESGE